MKIIQALLICTAICASFACKCHRDAATKAAGTTPSKPSTRQTEPHAAVVNDNSSTTQTIDVTSSANKVGVDSMPGTYRVAISFVSFGAGTDPDGRPMLDNYVQQYMDATSKRIIYDAHPWGREGEIDICFTLDNLTVAEQIQFVSGLRDVFKGHELVHVEENKKNNYRR